MLEHQVHALGFHQTVNVTGGKHHAPFPVHQRVVEFQPEIHHCGIFRHQFAHVASQRGFVLTPYGHLHAWCIDGPARLRELCGGGLQRSFAGQDDHEGCDLTKGHVPHNAGGITDLKQQQFWGREKEGHVELFGRRCTVLTPAAGHELQFTRLQWNQHLLQNQNGIVTVSRNIQRKLNGFTARPLDGQIADEGGRWVVNVAHLNPDLFITITNHPVKCLPLC